MGNVQKVLRALAAFALGLGLLTATLALGEDSAAHAQAAPAPRAYYTDDELPSYPGALEYPLGDDMYVNGLPIRVSTFTVKASAEQVRDYFVEEFAARGLQPDVQDGAAGSFTVSAALKDAAGMASVNIVPRKLRTEVYPTIVPMGVRPEKPAAGDEAPVTDNAIGMMRVEDRGESTGQVVTYQEPTETAPELAKKIGESMTAKGWSLTSQQSAPGAEKSIMLELSRDGLRKTLTLTPYKYEPRGTSVVMVTDAGGGE